ncbi:ABC transporter permease [Gaoshiqia sp. Z1-71]|uniref:ABC transporter permease n=1 Tax=Gaoshiqia hydrogeniformans TaxID=3290090 RepID=UPI003BF86EC1
MNLNFLKIFFRNLRKHTVISVINAVGLTIGILSSLFIFEYVFFERSFDRYHENGSRLCRLVYDRYQHGKLQWKTANSFFPSGKWLQENYSEVQDWAVITRKYNISVTAENVVGDKVFFNEEKTYNSTGSIFSLFTIPLIRGTKSCLDQPNTVAISERAAQRYFAGDNPLGKILKVNGTENYTVTAVYKNIPANSHLQTDFLFSLETYLASRPGLYANWSFDGFHTYILLAPGVNHEEFCKRALPDMVAQNYLAGLEASQTRDQYFLQPIPDIHLYSNIEYETEQPGNPKIMNILFGFAVFLLVVAWINYINLVTALSLERAREIGIRKINGARKISLVSQFLSEALLFNLACLAITLLLFLLINPFFKSVTNIRDFNLWAEPGFIRTGLLVFAVGIATSGLYPALALSSYKPVAVLKGKFKNTAQGLTFRKGLITVQFIISIALLTGTLVTFRQASFLMKKEMGVDYHSGLVVRAPRTADQEDVRAGKLMLFKNRALELPEVSDFTFSSDIPGQEINNWFSGRRKGYDGTDTKAYFLIAADDRFVDFYNIKLLAGRKFHENEQASRQTILMNKLAMERLGYSKPEDVVNQVVVNGPDREWLVIGVVDDFHYKSVKTEPVPTVISLSDRQKTFITLKPGSMPAGAFASLIPKLRSLYETVYPDQPFEYFSLDDKMRLDLKPDNTFASVFTLFSALAIFIAVIGMIGLILITINQNLKELGIRKALGAEMNQVAGLLSKQLMLQFAVAVVVAVPLSFYGYQHWFLETYIYRIDLHIWFFVLPTLLLSLMIFSVILILARRVFRMNLRDVLQYE